MSTSDTDGRERLNPEQRHVVVFSFLIGPFALFCVFYVFDCTLSLWADRNWYPLFSGVMHAPLAFGIVAFLLYGGSFLFVIALAWWASNRRTQAISGRVFKAWLPILAFCVIAPWPNPTTYASVPVFIFGPGKNTTSLKYWAVLMDSTLLARALIRHGTKFTAEDYCFGAGKSPNVLRLLADDGVVSTPLSCPKR
jgi:hypothetical protein